MASKSDNGNKDTKKTTSKVGRGNLITLPRVASCFTNPHNYKIKICQTKDFNSTNSTNKLSDNTAKVKFDSKAE